MSKKDEALKLALEALKQIDEAMPFPVAKLAQKVIREALAEQLAQGCDYCNHPQYAGIKCKNCGREQPAQQRPQNCGTGYCSCIECLFEPEHQEPVAYAVFHRMGGSKSLHWPEQHSEDGDHNEYQLVPLYTSPPASKPLTDEEIEAMSNDFEEGYVFLYRSFARAIEAAHGITKGNT